MTWIDSDLVLSGSGVLISLFRGIPLWRYGIDRSEVASIDNRLVMFKKQRGAELVCVDLPHSAAEEAIESFDRRTPEVDHHSWQAMGSSQWQRGAWVDQDTRISGRKIRNR